MDNIKIDFSDFSDYEKSMMENVPDSVFDKIETKISNNSLQMFVRDDVLSDELRMYIKAYRKIGKEILDEFRKVIREKEESRKVAVKNKHNIKV